MTDQSYTRKEISSYTEQAYLDYSMYVLLDRALPHLFDGLKPVQRRIIYAMRELNLDHAAKPKKSARTVGDVIGKYHPHGDSATYEAMVLMAQPFSFRYPFIQGQGNWGSPDEPKSFAAMRYTEAKLTRYAVTMTRELDAETVPWMENFDASFDEPVYLPARLPNLLLNGARGIAVGMTTNCMPHNIVEIIDAAIEVLNNPECTTDDLLKIVKGPDFPSACEIILSEEERSRIYESGQGSIRTRGLWELESSTDLIITSLPPLCFAPKCIEQIAAQIEKKKLPMVVDIRDESDHEHATRIVLKLRSNRVDATAVMQHLFATTELENTHRVHVNVINGNGRPEILGLKKFLADWLLFRRGLVVKRSEFRLTQINNRLQALRALLTVYDQLDAVIKIIREEDKPKPKLIKLLKVTDQQVETVLSMRLRQLAKLQQIELEKEAELLRKEQGLLEKLISSQENLDKQIIKELKEDSKTFGDARRCKVVDNIEPAKRLVLVEPKEPISVIISKAGWIRCLKEKNVDIEKLSFRSGDELSFVMEGVSTDAIIIFDKTGKSYTLDRSQIPDGRGYGEPVTKWLDMPADSEVMCGTIAQKTDKSLLMTNAGKGMIVKNKNLVSKIKAGKQILKMQGATKLWCEPINERNSQICVADSNGFLLIYDESEMTVQNSGAGVKAKALKNKSDTIVAVTTKHPTDTLVIFSGKRLMRMKSDKCEAYTAKRSNRGKVLSSGYKHVLDLTIEANEKLFNKYSEDLKEPSAEPINEVLSADDSNPATAPASTKGTADPLPEAKIVGQVSIFDDLKDKGDPSQSK